MTTFAAAPFASAELDELMLKGGALTWAAGPLAKGSNLCHGTGGNGYAFLRLHERTGEALWLDRARAFAMNAIAQWREAREAVGRGAVFVVDGGCRAGGVFVGLRKGCGGVSDGGCDLRAYSVAAPQPHRGRYWIQT